MDAPKEALTQRFRQPFKMTLEGMYFKLLPLYHPATVLHNGRMRPILKDDFLVLGAIIETLFDDSAIFFEQVHLRSDKPHSNIR